MMINKLLILLISIAFLGCKDPAKQITDNGPQTVPGIIKKLANIPLTLTAAERVDTSVYVMYKLQLSKTEDDTESEYGSSSGRYVTDYWNIVFYNTATGKYHLLDEQRKMRITVEKDDEEDGTKYGKDHIKADTLLYYKVTLCDANKDGKLTSEDPAYLFSSNKQGYNFKQISPDSLHVSNWQIIRSTNKLLLQVIKDTNKDGKYNDEDESIPYVFDMKTGELAKEVFADDFKQSIEQLKAKYWGKKKQ
jgi:hypothetical protein